MKLGETQPFASPEEALAHFGVKGMRWGHRKKRETSERKASSGEVYLKTNDMGHNDEGGKYRLKKPESLQVDTSRGFAVISPTKGIRTPDGAKKRQEMVNCFEELRKEYPAVANLKVEVSPLGRMPGAGSLAWSGAPAAVVHMRRNEVRIMYNEKFGIYPPDTPENRAAQKEFIPGFFEPGYVGRHEMGHVLAAAGGLLPPGFEKVNGKYRTDAELSKLQEGLHAKAFERHGMTFKELSRIGPYAASKPTEALAELYGHYSTPSLRAKMDPDLVRRAEGLFNELGGKKA